MSPSNAGGGEGSSTLTLLFSSQPPSDADVCSAQAVVPVFHTSEQFGTGKHLKYFL